MHPAVSAIHGPHLYQDRVFGELQPSLQNIVLSLITAAHSADLDLDESRSQSLQKLAMKLSGCCMHPIVYGVDEPERPVLVEARCKSRLCPRCSRIRRNKLLADLRYYVTLIDAPRFLTLTLKSTDDPLRDQLLRLRSCFAKLRRSKVWKTHVTGGLYTVEVTYNRKRQQWHPHIHAVIDGSYVPHADLVTAWELATGDSTIVDIRRCHGQADAVNYLADYISKSSDAENFPPAAMADWALNVHGLRFAARFGTLHKAILPAVELRRSVSGVSILCSAEHLAAASQLGDVEATMLLFLLKAAHPRFVPDGEPGIPSDDQAQDGDLAFRIRAWRRMHEELLRERYRTTESTFWDHDSYQRALRQWQVRADPSRDPLLPYENNGH